VVRPGDAVTVLAYGTMVHVAAAAVEESGIDGRDHRPAHVIAARHRHIVDSVKKTGRCVIAHEATRTCGFGAELVALVQEHCFLPPGGADRAGDRLDTPYRSLRMGLFPGQTASPKASAARWKAKGKSSRMRPLEPHPSPPRTRGSRAIAETCSPGFPLSRE